MKPGSVVRFILSFCFMKITYVMYQLHILRRINYKHFGYAFVCYQPKSHIEEWNLYFFLNLQYEEKCEPDGLYEKSNFYCLVNGLITNRRFVPNSKFQIRRRYVVASGSENMGFRFVRSLFICSLLFLNPLFSLLAKSKRTKKLFPPLFV